LHPVRSTAKKLNPATALREHQKLTPHRAGIATPPGQESATNRDRKARLIRPGSGRGSTAGFIPRSLMNGSFWTTGTVSDGTRNRLLMILATLLVNVGQLIVGIIALVILIRRK
jgi:hypothetical protein